MAAVGLSTARGCASAGRRVCGVWRVSLAAGECLSGTAWRRLPAGGWGGLVSAFWWAVAMSGVVWGGLASTCGGTGEEGALHPPRADRVQRPPLLRLLALRPLRQHPPTTATATSTSGSVSARPCARCCCARCRSTPTGATGCCRAWRSNAAACPPAAGRRRRGRRADVRSGSRGGGAGLVAGAHRGADCPRTRDWGHYEGLPPGRALRSARSWMLNDRREAPPGMPAHLRSRVRHIRGDDLSARAGFTHLGR